MVAVHYFAVAASVSSELILVHLFVTACIANLKHILTWLGLITIS